MNKTGIIYRLAHPSDLQSLIEREEVLFDLPIKKHRAEEFLNDSRHHLMLACDQTDIVGMVSGFVYVHPDKEPSLFINEVGVIETYQGNGIGTELINQLVGMAFIEFDCKDAWVLTDESNTAARNMYKKARGVESENRPIMIEFETKIS